jgi:hypothetical protein
MIVRPAISPGALYRLLNSEFKARRISGCTKCQMPLPYRVDRPDAVSANWRIGMPAECVHGCEILIAEIATALWPKFDLLDALPDADVPLRRALDDRANSEP